MNIKNYITDDDITDRDITPEDDILENEYLKELEEHEDAALATKRLDDVENNIDTSIDIIKNRLQEDRPIQLEEVNIAQESLNAYYKLLGIEVMKTTLNTESTYNNLKDEYVLNLEYFEELKNTVSKTLVAAWDAIVKTVKWVISKLPTISKVRKLKSKMVINKLNEYVKKYGVITLNNDTLKKAFENKFLFINNSMPPDSYILLVGILNNYVDVISKNVKSNFKEPINKTITDLSNVHIDKILTGVVKQEVNKSISKFLKDDPGSKDYYIYSFNIHNDYLTFSLSMPGDTKLYQNGKVNFFKTKSYKVLAYKLYSSYQPVNVNDIIKNFEVYHKVILDFWKPIRKLESEIRVVRPEKATKEEKTNYKITMQALKSMLNISNGIQNRLYLYNLAMAKLMIEEYKKAGKE